MKKRAYRTINVKDIEVKKLHAMSQGKGVVVGIDVAKVDFFARFVDADDFDNHFNVKWKHPMQTLDFIRLLIELPAESVEVALEPSGTYGDALVELLQQNDIEVFSVSPKRCHDAREILDGVPSSHDAKAAMTIAYLHNQKISKPWPKRSDSERAMKATLSLVEVFQGQFKSNINRLGALMAKHWPELENHMDLKSATILDLLATFGGPAEVAKNTEQARKRMRKTGRALLKEKVIFKVLASADNTIGCAQIPDEIEAVKVLVRDCLRSMQSKKSEEKKLKKLIKDNQGAANMTLFAGPVTAAALTACLGDLGDYECPKSLEKACGLNLKTRSSGKHKGRLKITKRGPGRVRHYLYLLALRVLQSDAVVGHWYHRKVERSGGVKMTGVIALMRKLIRALWHVARGEEFNSALLFDVNRLGLKTV